MPTTDAPSRPRRRLAPEARRAQILEVALSVFSESGYSASMADIGAQAGVTRTVLYHYFGTKEELFLAVAAQLQGELLLKLAPVVGSADGLAQRARAGLDALLDFTTEWPKAWNVLLPRGDAADPEVVRMREQVEEQLLTALAGTISNDLEAVGLDLSSVAGQVLVRGTMGAIVNVLTWWRDHPEVEIEEIREPLFAVIWRGATGAGNRKAGSRASRH
jgi:AcrR family transcriptional regulator